MENCPVDKILINENIFGTREVTGVSTTKGVITTDCIVNCGGMYIMYLQGLVGKSWPLNEIRPPFKRLLNNQYVFLQRLVEEKNSH